MTSSISKRNETCSCGQTVLRSLRSAPEYADLPGSRLFPGPPSYGCVLQDKEARAGRVGPPQTLQLEKQAKATAHVQPLSCGSNNARPYIAFVGTADSAFSESMWRGAKSI